MRIDKERRIWFSKEEMKVITGALLVLSYEIWEFERSKEFRSVKKKFLCSMEDLQYVKDWFASLYSEYKNKSFVFLFEDASKRLSVIHTALDKCNKHFKKYEVASLGQVTKQELDSVFGDFKKLLSELKSIEQGGGCECKLH